MSPALAVPSVGPSPAANHGCLPTNVTERKALRMPYSFKLSRRIARLRAPLLPTLILAAVACGESDVLDPDSGIAPRGPDQTAVVDEATTLAEAPVTASVAFAGGIPFGNWAQPTSTFGSVYNGAVRNIHASSLMEELAAIRSRGGRVALKLSNGDTYFKDAAGNFSLSKWKARVSLAKNLNLATYINDGTIIGHYLVDEPHDPHNWNGKPISPATLEEMAKFSKELWPNMPTLVRTYPDYLDNWSGSYRYLDAAWAQYAAHRWPNVEKFLDDNVARARSKGLALIVGLNTIKGSPTKREMSASQIKAYGSALLNSSYPCAFLMWQYKSGYNSSGSIRDAMSYLRNKAENRSTKSCRGS